jgi:hypothetical protein
MLPTNTSRPPRRSHESLRASSRGRHVSVALSMVLSFAAAFLVSAALTYIAAHLYLTPTLPHAAAQAVAAPVANAHESDSSRDTLALAVSQHGTALELQWDPLLPAIQSAVGANLVINDGVSTRQMELNRAQLRSGRVAYTPVFGDITFRLEVVNSTSHSIAESICVLRELHHGHSE